MARRTYAAYGISWLTDFVGGLMVFTVTRSLAEQSSGTLFMGLISGGFAATFSLTTFFSGRIADRLGYTRMIITATLLLFPCFLCAALVDSNNPLFYLAYILAGGALGMVYPPTVAWLTLADRGPILMKKLTGFCVAWNLGIISGQVVGSQLFGEWGHSTALTCAICFLPLNLLLVAWGNKTGPNSSHFVADNEQPEMHDHLVKLAAAFAVISWVANVGGTFSMSTIFFLLPELVVQIGITPKHQGGIMALSRVVVITIYFLMAISHRWRFRLTSILCSQALGVLGLLYLATAHNEIELIVGLVIFSILPAYNYFASLLYSTVGSTAQQRGTWCGIHEATFGVGLTFGSILGGCIGNYAGVRSCFQLAAVVVSILAMVQIILYLKIVLPLRTSIAKHTSQESSDDPPLDEMTGQVGS